MNVRVAHYEWKVAAIRFARKTGSYDRNRGSPLHLADFTNFQVIVERRFDVSVESIFKFWTYCFLNLLIEFLTICKCIYREKEWRTIFCEIFFVQPNIFNIIDVNANLNMNALSRSCVSECEGSSTALNVASRERGSSTHDITVLMDYGSLTYTPMQNRILSLS